MIKAIVYTSNSGYTKEYAELIARELKVKCLSLNDALKSLERKTEVIYLGWLMAGVIKGYNKAKKYFLTPVAVGVGMGREDDDAQLNGLKKKYRKNAGMFALQGGFDLRRLKGVYKFMMKSMALGIIKRLSEQKTLTEEEKEMLEMARDGKDCVNISSAEKVIDYVKAEQLI